MMLKQFSIHRQKEEKELYKKLTKWITDLDVSVKLLNFQKNTTREHFPNLGLGEEFLKKHQKHDP